MGNLNQVVNPAAVSDYRIIKRPPINTGISADFNVIADNHPAQLGNSFMLPVDDHKAKTVLTDTRPAENITVISHQAVRKMRPNANPAIIADFTIFINNGICLNPTVIADFNPGGYNCVLPDKTPGTNYGIGTDAGRSGNSGCGTAKE